MVLRFPTPPIFLVRTYLAVLNSNIEFWKKVKTFLPKTVQERVGEVDYNTGLRRNTKSILFSLTNRETFRKANRHVNLTFWRQWRQRRADIDSKEVGVFLKYKQWHTKASLSSSSCAWASTAPLKRTCYVIRRTKNCCEVVLGFGK